MDIRARTPRHLIFAGIISVIATITAAWWWLRPGWNHFAPGDSALLRMWLDPGQTAAVMLALGLLGTVIAAAGLRFPVSRRRLAAPAVLLAAGTLTLSGLGVIMATGYLVALVVPVGALFVLVQVVRRGGRARWATLAGATALMAILIGSGALTRDAVIELAEMPGLVAGEWTEIAGAYLLVALLAAWVLVAMHGDRGRLDAWVLRHRRGLTVLAAIGPLPYAVTRVSWLTPWPLLVPGELAADIRLWGLMLSTGAWAGFVLTLGLIRPWGEIFPMWMPGLGGREVPVRFAAVPGGFVAAVLTAAAIPSFVSGLGQDSATMATYALIMPFWAWGPLLGLAVWGYVLHRGRTGPTQENPPSYWTSWGPTRPRPVRPATQASTAVRRTAHVGVLAALAYAALKAAWGAGSTLGATDVVAFERFSASFGDFVWLATWGTSVLALVAAAILLALVEPWGARVPRLPLRLLAWAGAAVLAIPGFGGVGQSLLTYAGLLDGHDNGLAEWVFLSVYGSFAVLAVAFVVAAAHPTPALTPRLKHTRTAHPPTSLREGG